MQKFLEFIFQEKIVTSVFIFLFTFVLVKASKAIIDKIFSKGKDNYEMKKRTTIVQLVSNVIKFFLYAIAVMMILDIYGVDTKGIIASLGIAGVVLGLALQDTVQDLMSGISIILYNYYVVGDIVKINNFTGEVIELSLKSTKVKNMMGEVYVFSNRNMSSVVNLSQAKAGVLIKVPTAYEEKTEKVETALKEVINIIKKEKGVYGNSCYLGIDSFEDSSVNYAIIIYCESTMQWQIKRETLKVIKEIYERENIKIPYNQIEVHNGQNNI